ncbi:uncharacterized protein ATNIH1004_000584 [Aspergillus tanneri]|uniref:Uncharacterized protein n=1 Tax=Aspergillus tanneri TaxID=1220188 RepID=A0A5M9MXU0_9EURO|nr:uncharacterized protein ATNIH1004_000584 [Aspergillus tanneri]KAA8651688.1 hypothetical protein ATNIH1004_000584 [Aspergillus tanneri]
MSSIFRDPSVFDAFKRAASSKPSSPSHPPKVHVIDWVQELDGKYISFGLCTVMGSQLTGQAGSYRSISRNATVAELAQLPVPLLRIIFSPLDLPTSDAAESVIWLFEHYDTPSAFLTGRLRSVTHSFGAMDDVNGYNCAWFHYLCKNITITRDALGRAWISDPRPGAPQLQHGDSTWIRSGYFLRWAVGSNRDPEVTLLCFGASLSLEERLQQIPPQSISSSVIHDTYSLFAIILEELSLQMDNTVWDVMDVFRHIELNTLTTGSDRESFTGLHNVSKHILFLQESMEAVTLTVKNLSAHHRSILKIVPDRDRHATIMAQAMLTHVETQFQSIGLRLNSLEKRMQNIIALSFHLVTQDGNRIMQADSNSMATIAFMTLVFLPMSTISPVLQFRLVHSPHVSEFLDLLVGVDPPDFAGGSVMACFHQGDAVEEI